MKYRIDLTGQKFDLVDKDEPFNGEHDEESYLNGKLVAFEEILETIDKK